jgi:hypothetical protein
MVFIFATNFSKPRAGPAVAAQAFAEPAAANAQRGALQIGAVTGMTLGSVSAIASRSLVVV